MNRTIDTIIKQFTEDVRKKEAVAPYLWVEAGAELNILRADEDDKVFDLQQTVAKTKMMLIEERKLSVAMAKAYVEATDTYKELCKQKAKCERITEFIRLSKIMSKLKQDELHGF